MRGFTLFESLIYIALFALLISGGIICMQSLAESTERNRTRALIEMEGEFLLSKIGLTPSEYKIANATIVHETNGSTIQVSSPTISVSNYVVTGELYSFVLTALTVQGDEISQTFSMMLPAFP